MTKKDFLIFGLILIIILLIKLTIIIINKFHTLIDMSICTYISNLIK